jgi:hypothetical protein
MATFEEDFIREHGRAPTTASAHYCQDWDFMAIDAWCKEFECCVCDLKGVSAIRESKESK